MGVYDTDASEQWQIETNIQPHSLTSRELEQLLTSSQCPNVTVGQLESREPQLQIVRKPRLAVHFNSLEEQRKFENPEQGTLSPSIR